MSAITITISPTRTLVADGRLVAGESADVSVVGGVPAHLYLVDPGRDVVAACTSFVPGESSATGVLNLATVPLANLVADIPAGCSINLSCLLEDASGALIGYGFVPLVSAPMPDELVDLDIDFYLRASQVGAGLAIVDGKLVCTVNPDTYLTKTEAEATYATQTALAGKYTKPATGIPATDLAAAVQTSLGKADTALQTAPVTSVNTKTSEVTLYGTDIALSPDVAFTVTEQINFAIGKLNGVAHTSDLRYALGATITASAQLIDRTVNRVAPLASNASPIVLTFPSPQTGARDFLALVTNTTGNMGSITFTPPTGATVYGDGFTHSPASGETWLYSVTEEAANVFWCKSEKMEVAQ